MKQLKIIIPVIIVFLFIIFYFTHLRGFLTVYKDTKIELAEKENIYYRFKGKGIDPSEIVRELADKKRKLEREYQTIRSFAGSRELELSEDIVDPGLYFRSTLYKAQKEIGEIALERKINLPPNLGFSEREVPSAESARLLLKQLAITQFLLEAFFNSAGEESKVSVSSVTPLDFVEVTSREREELFYVELPVMVSLRTDMETFVKLLYEVKSTEEYFLVLADLEMKPAREEAEVFEITFLVNGLILP